MSLRRQFLLLGLLAGFLAAAPARTSGQPGNTPSHAEQGLALAREGKLEAAESELRQAAALAPANSEVLTTLGTVLARQQKFEASNQAFRKSLKLSPGNLMARRYLAANLWQLHRDREAVEHLQFILARQPNDKQSRLLLGMVSENGGDYATAARMLSSVPQEVQKQPESVAALARSYYHLGQTRRAQATLDQLSPAGPAAVFLGAQVADELQDYKTAERLFRSIETTFPDHSPLQYRLALVAYHSGRYAESQKILEPLLASAGKTAPALNLLGWCYQKQGQNHKAVMAVEEAIQLAPSEVSNFLDETKMLLAQRSLPSALRSARRTTADFPKTAAAFELQATVEQEMGQFTDAIHSFGAAMQLASSRAETLLGLARAQFAAGLNQEAADRFGDGIRRFPKDARFMVGYAELLLKQAEAGDEKAEPKAEQLLRAALILNPSLADGHYQLGNLALRKGRLLEAQQHLAQAVILNSKDGPAHFALSRVFRRLDRKTEADHEMELYEKLKHPGSANDPQE